MFQLRVKSFTNGSRLFLAVATALLVFYLGQSPIFGQIRSNITVDFASPKATVSMSGILHGIDPQNPPDAMVKPLQFKLWRAGRLDVYDRVVAAGAQFQLIVSDVWGYGTWNGWPYENYAKWEAFVRQLAQQHKGKKIMWDIWNEPDWANPFWPGTREQFFETYKRAYRVLRQELGPDAMIGGPSLARYSREYLTAFLDYCRANNLEVNFLSWHELDDNIVLFVDDHLIEARRNFFQSPTYRNLKIKKLYVNEIVGDVGQYRPGNIIGYLYYLEQGGADGACRACWGTLGDKQVSNCFNNTLAGMVTPNTFQPRAAWWVYKLYADGVAGRVASASDNQRVAALASRSNSQGNAQVLLGYFDQNVPPTTVTINLRNIQQLGLAGANGRIHLKLEKIPTAEENPVQQLANVKEDDVQLRGNSLQYVIPNVNLHEGYLLTLSKPKA